MQSLRESKIKKVGSRGAGSDKMRTLDSDLGAKLAARLARAEAALVPPSEDTVDGCRGAARASVDNLRAPVDSDLMAKLSMRKKLADTGDAPQPLTGKEEVSGDAVEQGRSELVSFLANVGELPAEHMTMEPELGDVAESGVILSDMDLGAMMIGHGAGLIGHGGGWGDGALGGMPDTFDAGYLPPYDPSGTGDGVGDPLLEQILRGTLAEAVNAGAVGSLEQVLADALGGEDSTLDPVNDVPVNWGNAAAAVWDGRTSEILGSGDEDEGTMFGFTIGTIDVEDEHAQAVRGPGRVPAQCVSDPAALGQLPLDAGVGGMQKAVGWKDVEAGAYPLTGAQRRAVIAERERELERQRLLAQELIAVQREQAQARFAEYKGPPCGVGMALQASTRMLMGTLRNHKRWVIQVDSLLPEGPAAKSGQILPGDVLLSVREEADKVGTTLDNRVEDAKALIMGPPGSVVILRFTRGDTMREHTHASFEVSLVREEVKHPPSLPVTGMAEEEEVDWALLPEQATVEPGDTPLSLEGVPLATMSNEKLQALLTGEEGKMAEMIVRKKDGSQVSPHFLIHFQWRLTLKLG